MSQRLWASGFPSGTWGQSFPPRGLGQGFFTSAACHGHPGGSNRVRPHPHWVRKSGNKPKPSVLAKLPRGPPEEAPRLEIEGGLNAVLLMVGSRLRVRCPLGAGGTAAAGGTAYPFLSSALAGISHSSWLPGECSLSQRRRKKGQRMSKVGMPLVPWRQGLGVCGRPGPAPADEESSLGSRRVSK